jgi:hypothetical protein
LSPDARFVWAINESLVGDLASMFQASGTGVSYPGVFFKCRFLVVSDEANERSIRWLRFFEGVVFRCITSMAAPSGRRV